MARDLGAFAPDVVAAIWQLAWAGHVTNDTLAPLRTLGRREGSAARSSQRGMRRGFRSRRAARLPGSDGRWSLLPTIETSTTERQLALARVLLERHGIVTRSAVSKELVPGGFSAIYPVLKQMEESGKVRRGYFVAGLGGAQFAMPGAGDLLRKKPNSEVGEAWLLAASDPANPYGSSLDWPEPNEGALRPQRAAGARVVLHNGTLVAWVNRGAGQITTFLPEGEPDRSDAMQMIADALAHIASRGEGVLLTKINGESPVLTDFVEPLANSGFVRTLRGLVWRERTAPAPVPTPALE